MDLHDLPITHHCPSPIRLLPSFPRQLHCERRTFDHFHTQHLLIAVASHQGYVVLFSNDSPAPLVALDVATDDWCSMDASVGYERLADDSPMHLVCTHAKLYVIGQSTADGDRGDSGGCEVRVQCFDFARRKWTRVASVRARANPEFITGGVIETRKGSNARLLFHILCADSRLLELTIEPRLARLLSIDRHRTNFASPLLNTARACSSIEECDDLRSRSPSEWRWLERAAFFDRRLNRLLWFGLSNLRVDIVHILESGEDHRSQSNHHRRRSWTSYRIPRNTRAEIVDSSTTHGHSTRLAYLVETQKVIYFSGDGSGDPRADRPTHRPRAYSLDLRSLADGWQPLDTSYLAPMDLTTVCGGELEEIYCLNRTIVHKRQRVNLVRLFLGIPTLKFLALRSVIEALDPKTKTIRRADLMNHVRSSDLADDLWYRTKLDRGVLRYLSRGSGFDCDFVKDDDKVSFFNRVKLTLLKRF